MTKGKLGQSFLAFFSVWRCSGILVASETQHDARRARLELRFRRKNRGRWPAWHFEGAGIVEAGFFEPALISLKLKVSLFMCSRASARRSSTKAAARCAARSRAIRRCDRAGVCQRTSAPAGKPGAANGLKKGTWEHRPPACSRRQSADDARAVAIGFRLRTFEEAFGSCRKGQAGSLCSQSSAATARFHAMKSSSVCRVLSATNSTTVASSTKPRKGVLSGIRSNGSIR